MVFSTVEMITDKKAQVCSDEGSKNLQGASNYLSYVHQVTCHDLN